MHTCLAGKCIQLQERKGHSRTAQQHLGDAPSLKALLKESLRLLA